MKPCNTSISTSKETNKNNEATTEDDVFQTDTLKTNKKKENIEKTIIAEAEIRSERIGMNDDYSEGIYSVL